MMGGLLRRLLYLGPADSLDQVRACLGNGYRVDLALDDQTVDGLIAQADVVLDAYMRVRFNGERLARATKLALFVTATTGADHIDAAALAARGIPLLTLKGQQEVLRNITPAAEHSCLLLMACARRLRAASESVLQGEWDRNRFPGIMLRGKVLGLVGCGRIGQWMARYATAFGMQVLGFDPYLQAWPDFIQPAPLADLLGRVDFIGVHVPLCAETTGLLGAAELALVKPGAILVNSSRGEIVDEVALLNALESGRLAAAGLDVLAGEPDVADHPLLRYAKTHANLLITPHIGGFSPDALAFVLEFSCGRISTHFGTDAHA